MYFTVDLAPYLRNVEMHLSSPPRTPKWRSPGEEVLRPMRIATPASMMPKRTVSWQTLAFAHLLFWPHIVRIIMNPATASRTDSRQNASNADDQENKIFHFAYKTSTGLI
eukprot:gb/GEZJ01007496.1/.p1 GENE.gb/GEZJ01007496.1/~~gb/GEZJ01007496.1/.p1  ORF type:complete len:110 (-),score=2.88 gb/GEZJ01007496.1/:17-346(-)